jgi:hypothetical protein
MIRVVEAKLVKDFTLFMRFNDGAKGIVNLSAELEGPIFKPLQDPEYFSRFHLHPDLHTVVWPNGADFAPEFLYELLQVPV